MANHRPGEELVFVLVLTQIQMLRLLDGSEDNLLRCRKQEAPFRVPVDLSCGRPLRNSSGPRRRPPSR